MYRDSGAIAWLPIHASGAPRASFPFGPAPGRLFWSWWPWAAICVVSTVFDRWAWAIGTGAMAFVSYLIAPTEASPRYGLDHEFSVADEEFLDTMAGATGVTFVAGNRIDILNNGDEFYPAMLDAIASAEASITLEAYIYWAGRIGVVFAEALTAKAASGVPVKLLLDAVGSATIGDEILKTLEKGGCQLAWYNPIRWYTIGRINHRTHRKSLIVGTTNFDSRSFAHNEENNVCFYDGGLAGRLRDTFVADLDGCDRIDLAAWSRRGVWTKTQEVFAAFLQEQT